MPELINAQNIICSLGPSRHHRETETHSIIGYLASVRQKKEMSPCRSHTVLSMNGCSSKWSPCMPQESPAHQAIFCLPGFPQQSCRHRTVIQPSAKMNTSKERLRVCVCLNISMYDQQCSRSRDVYFSPLRVDRWQCYVVFGTFQKLVFVL